MGDDARKAKAEVHGALAVVGEDAVVGQQQFPAALGRQLLESERDGSDGRPERMLGTGHVGRWGGLGGVACVPCLKTRTKAHAPPFPRYISPTHRDRGTE